MRVQWRGLELPTRVVRDDAVSTREYGRFVIEPFERGFGTTVGNSLRRILLSSLEGSAVTHARIAGADHEFMSLPGVLEDVTDIILNIKQMVVDVEGDEPKKIRVNKKGAGEVKASDFEAEAGVTCAKLAREAARAGLAGAEFLAGIPGTVGGALAMNAGAFGGETWEAVTAVQTVDRRGVLRWRGPKDYRVGYRQVQGPEGEWFVAGRFRYAPGDVGAAQDRIRALLARRGETQPTRQPSCGSVFRNPPGDHAARLIEAAGLKGACIGGACVSELHANFIVNTGTATAADIEALIRHVQERVASQFGVRLEPEVRIVGVPA